MRKDPMPLGIAIGLFVVGIFLGTVFSFGMQYWNKEVTRESCKVIQTEFLSYSEIPQPKRSMEIMEIATDCANGERYFIDGVSINTKLRNEMNALSKNEEISLLIHPNANTIVEFSTNNGNILKFDETINKLSGEATGFLFLGVFMYFSSLVGLYYMVLHFVKKRNR